MRDKPDKPGRLLH